MIRKMKLEIWLAKSNGGGGILPLICYIKAKRLQK